MFTFNIALSLLLLVQDITALTLCKILTNNLIASETLAICKEYFVLEHFVHFVLKLTKLEKNNCSSKNLTKFHVEDFPTLRISDKMKFQEALLKMTSLMLLTK